MKHNIYLLLILFITLQACGGDSENSGTSSDNRQVFHYNQPTNVTSLDPAFARIQTNIWAVDHLYNRLVELDDNLNIVPSIAKSWDISEDGLTYTFQLRDDVFFHDNEAFADGKGRAVVAQDVVYSLQRILDESLSSPGSWIFKGRLAAKDAFTAPDAHTFVMKLKEPFRPMLGIMTMHYCSVVPKEATDKYGKDFRTNPVGTGAFQFKKWLENQSLILMKNPNYFEKGLPYLDGVRVSFMAEKKTAFLEFMNGKLDFISGLSAEFVDELLTPEGELLDAKKDKVQFIKAPYLNSEYLGINVNLGDKSNPLKAKKVRQALNYGFDRVQMMRSLRNNVGKPANSGFTPIGLPSFSPQKVKGYDFNPDKARKLLSEAGFPNGKNLPTITLETNKDYLDLCTYIVRQWEDIGIKAKIDVVESATLRNKMRKESTPFFRGSWIADYPDAESFFTVFYGKNPAPPNYTRFQSATFDKYYEQALKENNDTKRYDLYQKMDAIVVDEAPVVFLFYDETALCAAKNISGLSRNALNLLSLKKVRKE